MEYCTEQTCFGCPTLGVQNALSLHECTPFNKERYARSCEDIQLRGITILALDEPIQCMAVAVSTISYGVYYLAKDMPR